MSSVFERTLIYHIVSYRIVSYRMVLLLPPTMVRYKMPQCIPHLMPETDTNFRKSTGTSSYGTTRTEKKLTSKNS